MWPTIYRFYRNYSSLYFDLRILMHLLGASLLAILSIAKLCIVCIWSFTGSKTLWRDVISFADRQLDFMLWTPIIHLYPLRRNLYLFIHFYS